MCVSCWFIEMLLNEINVGDESFVELANTPELYEIFHGEPGDDFHYKFIRKEPRDDLHDKFIREECRRHNSFFFHWAVLAVQVGWNHIQTPIPNKSKHFDVVIFDRETIYFISRIGTLWPKSFILFFNSLTKQIINLFFIIK